MNSGTLITIYIPTYNREPYLRRALTSMRLQTLGKDTFRVVVADNCSSDNTPEVVKEFADLNIVYLRREENIGLLRNWRDASSFFQTPFFHFLSDDDLLAPYHLEYVLNKLSSNPDAGLIAMGSLYGSGLWETESNRADIRLGDEFLNEADMCCYWSTDIWLAIHSVATAVCLNSTLFRTETIQDISPLFDDCAAQIADRLLMAKVGLKTKCITSPWPTCMMIEHGKNQAHGGNPLELEELARVVAREILDLSKRAGYDLIRVWRNYFNGAGREQLDLKYLVYKLYPAEAVGEILEGWVPQTGRLDQLPLPETAKRGIRALKNSIIGR